MTQERADQLIGEWRSRIALASENLLALDDTAALKRIEGRDGSLPVAFTGVTAARLTPALAAMRELFSQVGTLTETVDRAARLRKSLNRLWKYEETLTEIERLLTGPSISLPAIQTPLADRGLISASQNSRAISADRLLDAMVSSFRTAKEAVLAVEAAWERQGPLFDAAREKAEALSRQAEGLHLAPPPELAEAQRRIAEAQRRALTDPLGAAGGGLNAQIASLLSAAREKIDEGRQWRERTNAGLAQAAHALAEIRRCQASALAAYAETRARTDISAPLQAPPSDAQIREIEIWLSDIERTVREEHWEAAQIGLGQWMKASALLLEAGAASQAANAALLDLPAEMKGRIAVLRVRAAHGAQGATNSALTRLIAQAETLLGESPIPLAQVRRLVEASEALIRRENETRTKV